MLVLVRPIYYESGKRRTASHLRELRPFVGRLSIADVQVVLPGRPKRLAEVRHPERPGKEAGCGPLYDPVIDLLDDKAFYLRGFSIYGEGAEASIRMQAWQVCPASDAEVDGWINPRR